MRDRHTARHATSIAQNCKGQAYPKCDTKGAPKTLQAGLRIAKVSVPLEVHGDNSWAAQILVARRWTDELKGRVHLAGGAGGIAWHVFRVLGVCSALTVRGVVLARGFLITRGCSSRVLAVLRTDLQLLLFSMSLRWHVQALRVWPDGLAVAQG